MTRATALNPALGITLAALLAAAPLQAGDIRVRTEAGGVANFADATSLEAAHGYQNSFAAGGGVRLMAEGGSGPVSYAFHVTAQFATGSAVSAAAAMAPTTPAPPPTLFNLTRTWASGTDTVVTGTIDRAAVGFTTDNLVVKVGRQAITWGSGMVFHPADIVAPFAPDAIDTSYKPGVDMLYTQLLLENGADIQAIAVPRAARYGGKIRTDQSTLALRAAATFGAVDAALTLAYDRGDYVGAIGLSGPLGDASWNAEFVDWRLAGGGWYPSWLVNVSNFTTIGDWNVSYFGEYFHNGFGVAASTPLDSLPASLTKRMSTGQVFFGGRDFLAAGGQIQLTPDLSVTPNAIVSVQGLSALASVGVNYSLGDNTDLTFNYSQPFGPDGSEFGGRETSAGSGVYVGPARSASLRLVHYF